MRTVVSDTGPLIALLNVTGVVGVLIQAKSSGLLAAVCPLLETTTTWILAVR